MAKIKYLFIQKLSKGDERWVQHIFHEEEQTRCGETIDEMRGDKFAWDLDPTEQPSACMECNQA